MRLAIAYAPALEARSAIGRNGNGKLVGRPGNVNASRFQIKADEIVSQPNAGFASLLMVMSRTLEPETIRWARPRGDRANQLRRRSAESVASVPLRTTAPPTGHAADLFSGFTFLEDRPQAAINRESFRRSLFGLRCLRCRLPKWDSQSNDGAGRKRRRSLHG
jgi:hypothetical protein